MLPTGMLLVAEQTDTVTFGNTQTEVLLFPILFIFRRIFPEFAELGNSSTQNTKTQFILQNTHIMLRYRNQPVSVFRKIIADYFNN